MADDPNRDILPVKEGSCADTCRSNIDPRERHFVCKLDRYQLEDRYLRLLDEACNLKKLSNCQEDKIKRLATKLMRVSSNSRSCNVALDVHDDKNKITGLELENAKLKEKISVLRNQLLSHTIVGRSSSKSRNPQARPSSGRITCRSENSRTKVPSCQCIVDTGNDDNDTRSFLVKIEELEAQRKEMSSRIVQLEKELSASTAMSQREKAAENVEYIKVWRQMKQLNDKLIAAQSTNESLNVQINDLKRILEETTKNNQEVTAALVTEKKRMAEVNGEMLKAKESQQSLREKDEQIRDLMNEMKILQQHNSELVALSSKYGQVEVENVELKKKLTEQLHDQQTLKTAFNTEQANIVALQSANEQLLQKLQELQKNIDSLTVQLKSFQTQTEKQESSTLTQTRAKQDNKKVIPYESSEPRKDTATETDRCKKCCETYKKILQLEEVVYTVRDVSKVSKSVQANCTFQITKKDQETSPMTPIKEKPKEEPRISQDNVERKTMAENPLTPEKMLRLLDQAKINQPSDTSRIAHKDMGTAIDYTGILDLNQRHSDEEEPVQNSQESPISSHGSNSQKIDKGIEAPTNSDQSVDPQRILTILLKILQEESSISTLTNDITSLYRPQSPCKIKLAKDINNNVNIENNRAAKRCFDANSKTRSTAAGALNSDEKKPKLSINVQRRGCNAKKFCSNVNNKLRLNRMTGSNSDVESKRRTLVPQYTKTAECTCNDALKCYGKFEGGYQCCSSCSTQSIVEKNSKSANFQYGVRSMPIKTAAGDVPSGQENVTTVSVTRTVQNEGNAGSYRSWDDLSKKKTGGRELHEYVEQLNKCRELLGTDCPLNSVNGKQIKKNTETWNYFGNHGASTIRRTESSCSSNCPKDCTETSGAVSDPFPLVIADGQGLIEIHILCLQLSTSAKQILFRVDDISSVSLFINWNIWDQEAVCTPTLQCPKLNFNSSFVYRLSDLFGFFNHVLSEYVIFQANVDQNNDSYVVARAKLCIKDILDYPQNKLHYIAPMNSVIPCTLGMNFGQLSLWVRLSCDVEKVEAFKKQFGLHMHTEYARPMANDNPSKEELIGGQNDLLVLKEQNPEDSLVQEPSKNLIASLDGSFFPEPSIMSDERSESVVQPTLGQTALAAIREETIERDESHLVIPSEVERDQESSLAILAMDNEDESSEEDKNVYKFESSKGQSIEKQKPQEPEVPSPMEISSKMEFDALLANEYQAKSKDARGSNTTLQDVEDVLSDKNWEEYRRRSLHIFASSVAPGAGENNENEGMNNRSVEKDTIIIEIVNVILFQKSSVMQDDEIRLIYVEYSFLGYRGADMETTSVEKPKTSNEKMTYNFRKKFKIDEQHHEIQRNTLRAMLDETINPNIRFILVSEPVPEETDFKDCSEVGVASFNIREYALGDSDKSISLPIMSWDQTEPEQIGVLKIFVLGLDAIRQCLGESESEL